MEKVKHGFGFYLCAACCLLSFILTIKFLIDKDIIGIMASSFSCGVWLMNWFDEESE